MEGSDLERLRGLARAALASLEASRRRIDDLNVFPVPDGDTGTNLVLTARAVVDELDGAAPADRAALAHRIARSALMGARGNSGVILSQIVRGAVDVLGAASEIDTEVLVRAFRAAAAGGYQAVREPVEGTMLSAIAAVANEAERKPADFWPSLVRACEAAVARTPEQLDVLREAGVVDAGAAGLLELLRGLAAAVTGAEIPAAPPELEAVGVRAVHQEVSRYRYCTTYVVEGEALDPAVLEEKLVRLGDSLLVVGDATALKIHVHTDDPGAALSLGTAAGTIDRVEIANMHEQTAAREERLLEAVPDAASAVVAVVAGEGNRALFESLGAARIVEGGQTMNPSTADLVAAIEAAPGNQVIILPNNSNVVLSAEQAARLASRSAEVVRTESLQAGLAAMVAFNADRSAADNAEAMRAVLAAVATGEVTVASRDVELNGLEIRKGSYLGLAGGTAVAGGSDFDAVASAVAERLLAEPRDVLTLLTGADDPDVVGLVEAIRERHPELELDVQHGGQPHYPLLLSAE
ncbi:MAG TPA: DAK2 domain-containing protein [Gaiellaceae bacterium]|nr:DAK2 domain-containing protein [Gaiellaceae bacterium]